MGKEFLRLMADLPKYVKVVCAAGILVSLLLGGMACYDRNLENGNELFRKEPQEGSYEQEIIAYIGKEKIPMTVTVEPRIFSKEEAELQFVQAEENLSELLKGNNESLSKISSDLNFVDWIPETAVEVIWTEKQPEYFYGDGTIREDRIQSESVDLKFTGIFVCQEYTKDFELVCTVLPKVSTTETKLLQLIEEENSRDLNQIRLPKEFLGNEVTWKKPMDLTFAYVCLLTIASVTALIFGKQKDERDQKKQRVEELEKEYAQIVSKFTMLLSAGLSVRNAWERIVFMQKRKGIPEKLIDLELRCSLHELQKGIPELSVYERFGQRVEEIHFKKLMALFISDKRRGSIPLLDAMNQEMLSAWEERKRKTRQQGEKIGTKLLIPMMGMLSVVFLIILVPAFLSLKL